MPIYEFYCKDCHTIYNFFARSMNTKKRPKCPVCGRPRLERWAASRFAIGRAASEADEAAEEDGLPPGLDEDKLEEAMLKLADEVESMDEEDPRQMAGVMRKLAESTGLELGDALQEAVHRLEQGEDPDKIEEEMGDLLDDDSQLFKLATKKGVQGVKEALKHLRPPKVDETLYDL
ncbi:zinc ribbon domain-containing protein [Thermostilla marina]